MNASKYLGMSHARGTHWLYTIASLQLRFAGSDTGIIPPSRGIHTILRNLWEFKSR